METFLNRKISPDAKRTVEALRKEFAFCRKLLVGCGALTIAAILCVAPFLLPLFGNYAGAWSFLVWLAIPPFVQSFYETSDRLLIIAGEANVPLAITATTFAMLVASPFVTAPLLGPTAIAVAMVVATLLLYPLAAARVHAVFDLRTIHPADMLMMGAGVAALLSYAITGVATAGIASISVLSAIGLRSLDAFRL